MVLFAAQGTEFESALGTLALVRLFINLCRCLAFELWAPTELLALINSLGNGDDRDPLDQIFFDAHSP